MTIRRLIRVCLVICVLNLFFRIDCAAEEPISKSYAMFLQIEGGVPRYLSFYESDVFGLYKFAAACGMMKLQWRLGVIGETSIYSVSISNLDELKNDNIYQHQLPSAIERDIRISANKVGVFLDFAPLFLSQRIGALNHENCVHIVGEIGFLFHDVRSASSGSKVGGQEISEYPLWYLDLGIRFTQRINRHISVFSLLELGFIDNRFDAFPSNGAFDQVASFSIGLEINTALPRPHRFN